MSISAKRRVCILTGLEVSRVVLVLFLVSAAECLVYTAKKTRIVCVRCLPLAHLLGNVLFRLIDCPAIQSFLKFFKVWLLCVNANDE